MSMSSPVPSDRRRVPRGPAERRNLSRRRPGIWTPAERERFIAEIREASPQMRDMVVLAVDRARRSPRFPPLATRPARASSAGHDISALGDVLAPVMAEDVATLDVLGVFPSAQRWPQRLRGRRGVVNASSAPTSTPDPPRQNCGARCAAVGCSIFTRYSAASARASVGTSSSAAPAAALTTATERGARGP